MVLGLFSIEECYHASLCALTIQIGIIEGRRRGYCIPHDVLTWILSQMCCGYEPCQPFSQTFPPGRSKPYHYERYGCGRLYLGSYAASPSKIALTAFFMCSPIQRYLLSIITLRQSSSPPLLRLLFPLVCSTEPSTHKPSIS